MSKTLFTTTPSHPNRKLCRAKVYVRNQDRDFQTEKKIQLSGAKDEDDIIKKFKTQRETRERLVKLKETVEREKKELEKKKEKLEAELEAQKFAQVKEKE
ncbi:unnamed protein product, partial [Nesidiocoris tenuis]